MSHDFPIVIEVVDSEEKINEIMAFIEPMITEGLIVIMHEVEIVKYVKSDCTIYTEY